MLSTFLNRTKACLSVLSSVIFTVPAALVAQESKNSQPSVKTTGGCFTVHGRLRTYNGIGMVIWWIGTDRKLAVGEQKVPPVLQEQDGVDYFGDFEVCPLSERREGEMQWVSIKSVTRVVVVDHRPEDKGKKAIVRKLNG